MLLFFLAPLITAIILFFLKNFYNKPKLIAYYGNISTHTINPPEGKQTTINTHEIVVRNSGKLPAKNIRLGHNFLPDYNVMQKTAHEVVDIPGGGKEILFPVLAPKDQINISYIYLLPVTYHGINTHVKSDEGLAKIIKVIHTPTLNTWQKSLAYFLLFMGTSSVFYILIIMLLKWLR